MRRLVGLAMVAAALMGCSQTRDELRPTEGLAPASLPPGLPPIRRQINDGPVADTRPPAPAVRVSGFSPGINGDGAIDPPRMLSPSEMQAERGNQAPMTAEAIAPAIPPMPPPERIAAATPAPVPAEEVQDIRGDAEVSQVSAPATAPVVGQPVGEWAARVDNDIITWHELQSAVARRMRELDPQMQAAPDIRAALASSVLDHLIDRSLVIQKARRNELKDPKRWEMINKGAVEFFERERLPALLKQYKAADRFELERILTERGESIDEILDSFKLEFVYQQFLVMNVASRVTVDLPELRAYYFEQRDHESFQKGAELTWREVVVKFANHPTREAARAKIDEAVARIGRGESFEDVARSMSEGPNADQGGLWATAPGSYAVAQVNRALESLSPGATSAVVEGPTGYHVVRLDANRPAGRMSFEEAQDAIRDILKARKEAEEIDRYLKNLYAGAVVTTVFSEYVPRHLRKDGLGG